MGKSENLVPYWGSLKPKEREALFHSIQLYQGTMSAQVFGAPELTNMGAMPFYPVHFAREAITMRIPQGGKLFSNILTKLKEKDADKKARFTMHLNTKKVIRQFGVNPERGKPLPIRKRKVTAGVKWSLGHKRYIPDDDVMVSIIVALKFISKSKGWQVECQPDVREEVTEWLMRYCQ